MMKKGDSIRFKMMNDLSGKEEELSGKILGDSEAVRKQFPEECGEVSKNTYLVKAENRSGLYVIFEDEVLN